VPVAALISTDPTNGPHTTGVPFKFDASPKIRAFSSTIIHHFTTLNSLTSRDCATFQTTPVELHRKFPVASLPLRLGRQHMRVKLCAQCDGRIVKPVIAIRQNCQRARHQGFVNRSW
jgi:hypothetical protein